MILFNPPHILPILEGRKTQTRRLWPHGCRVKVGGVHQARTRMLDKTSTFAYVEIARVWQENVWDISEEDAREEGYQSRLDFLNAFAEINKIQIPEDSDSRKLRPLMVWAVGFTLA